MAAAAPAAVEGPGRHERPAQSGPTYPFIAGMMNYLGGVNAGETYFTKLKANGLVIHTQTINPYTWGPQEGTINTWFDGNIVR